MKFTAKLPLLVVLALLVIPALFFGCGKANTQTSVPDGATITISPVDLTATIGDNATFEFSVTVRDKDDVPIWNAPLRIDGSYAVPLNSTNTSGLYQFYDKPGGDKDPTNQPMNSGFKAYTDYHGVYNFSITVFYLYAGATNAFTDNINIRSGTAFGSVPLSINQ